MNESVPTIVARQQYDVILDVLDLLLLDVLMLSNFHGFLGFVLLCVVPRVGGWFGIFVIDSRLGHRSYFR